ncbi:MAG: GxGYxYP family putative glycoside hydrolase, partial [Polyangiales bacterium]
MVSGVNWVVSRASAVGLVVALVGCSGAETLPGSFEARDGAKEDSADGKTRSYDCDTPSWNDSDWLAESGCYYVLDVRELYLNTWCYAVGSCTAGTPPSGTTIEQQIDRHDQLAFLTSLQGIVNRDRATLFLVAEDKPDAEWLRLLAKENIWLNDMHRVDVASVDDAITLFADHPALKGSVRWSDAEPFTMNVAFSLAGADDLVVVREGSAFADKVTARFPVQESLGGRFASKRAGYEWLIDNYLTTGKLAPELALYTDGWVVNRAKAGNFLSLGWALMPRDGLVARRQMFIGYGVHPNGPDPSQPSAPKGEGRTVLGKAFAAIRARVGPNKLITAGGWPSAEYSFDCNGDNVINGSDKVGCEEWEWTEFASTLGAVLRMGGPGAYAKEAANASFYQHGPGVDVLDQPAPKTPFELLEDGDIAGPPANFSFEAGDASWTLTATNRAVYNQAANAQHGSRFLQANVSAGDVGKGFYQDTTANLPTGSLVRFSIQARATSAGANAKGRLRVTAGGNQLCLTSFTLNDSTWRELDCDFEVKSAGLANPRIEVLLDTAGPNYAFDTAQLLGT